MKKRLLNYIRYLESLNFSELSCADRAALLQDLLTQISFFQHERLIHLLVTLAFSVFTVIALLCFVIMQNIFCFALIVLFLALTIPYIIHYYTLENGVQKLYTFYDRYKGKI